IQDMAAENPRVEVGFAAVIDDFGAAASYRAVNRPVVVQRKQVGDGTLAAPLGLPPADLLARVFDDLPSLGDPLEGIYPAPVDCGLPNYHPVAGETWIDRGRLDEGRCHSNAFYRRSPARRI